MKKPKWRKVRGIDFWMLHSVEEGSVPLAIILHYQDASACPPQFLGEVISEDFSSPEDLMESLHGRKAALQSFATLEEAKKILATQVALDRKYK